MGMSSELIGAKFEGFLFSKELEGDIKVYYQWDTNVGALEFKANKRKIDRLEGVLQIWKIKPFYS